MKNENRITEFFGSDYISFASYDGIRKIASFIDGLKPTARKVVFTVLDLKLTQPKKVDSIKSKVADHTEYIHGQDAIEGVIVNLAQNFVGAQNIPLMIRDGSFGTRLIPDAAASRYIRSAQEEYLKNIFLPDDNSIIGNQEFEGSKIEPKFYVPIIPMLLVNGSEGIAVGYAQKILPRDPMKLMEYLFTGMKDLDLLLPSYTGFKGEIVKTDDKSFEIRGIVVNKNTTTYEIIEVPVGYTYTSYKKVLDRLEDSGMISSYEDRCDMDKDVFSITVRVKREQHQAIKKMSDTEVLDYFKLIKRVTENYTCLNEKQQIEVFDTVDEIIKRYAQVRISYYKARKEYVEEEMLKKMLWLKSKIVFIQKVSDSEFDIKNWDKETLIASLDSYDTIVKRNDSYDYLLNLPIWSINKDMQMKAVKELKSLAAEYTKYQTTKISTIWKNEYKELCKKLT